MFDIGWQELIVLGAVALVVFPPKEFPNLLKTLISVTNKVRATTQELQHHIHNFSKTHLEDLSVETAKTRNLIHDSSRRIQKQIEDLENRAKSAAKNPNPKKSSKTTSPKISPPKVTAKKSTPPTPKTAPLKPSPPKAKPKILPKILPKISPKAKPKRSSQSSSKPSPSIT